MKAELRADGLHIFGYVNVPGRASRPVLTPRGKVVEIIEPRVFADAIKRANVINMLLDHNKDRVLASTQDNTLKVQEDEIGLRAESVVTDEEVIKGAQDGKLKGWSFNMRNVKDSLEVRDDGLPIRHINALDMDEITLVMNRVPIYSATSVEVRAEGEEEVETRAIYLETTFSEEKQPGYDNSAYLERLKSLER